MQESIRYSETQDTMFTIGQLESMNLVELKELFNTEASATCANPTQFKPIAKFSDKANAVRRVWAVLTEVPDNDDKEIEADDSDDNTLAPADPRDEQVTCTTCGHTGPKRHFELVGAKWYCSDEDACSARLNPTVCPNEHNAPEGMVFCGICKQHVPADSAEQTADPGIYTCKELCVGKGKKSLKDKAKAASTKAKREPRQPKEKTERKVMFPNSHVITRVADCPKKNGSKAEKGYELYQIGMTVAEYLELAVKHDCYGREALKYDVQHGFIAIEAPTAE